MGSTIEWGEGLQRCEMDERGTGRGIARVAMILPLVLLAWSALGAGAKPQAVALPGGGGAQSARANLDIGAVDLSELPVALADQLRSSLRPAAAREISPLEMRQARRLREELGLRSDLEYIAAQYRSEEAAFYLESSSGDFYGLRLTPREVGEVAMRNYLQLKAPDVYRALEATGYRLGGRAIMSNASGAFLQVYVAVASMADRDSARAIAVSSLSPIGPERVVVLRADADIETLQKELGSAISRLRDAGLRIGGYIDEVLNVAVLTTDGDSDRARAERLVPSSDRLRYSLSAAGGPTADKNQAQPFGLVFGGLNIGCTTANAVHGAFGPFVLTAGHCYPLNTQIWQGGAPMGPIAARNNTYEPGAPSNRYDAAAIATANVRPQLGRNHINSSDWAHQVTGWIGTDSDSVGDFTCHTGHATNGQSGYNGAGTSCGTVTNRFYAPAWMGFGGPFFRRTTYVATLGDSGASVYWNTAYGQLAVGIQSGCDYIPGSQICNNGVYSHLPYVTNDWGLSVDTN